MFQAPRKHKYKSECFQILKRISPKIKEVHYPRELQRKIDWSTEENGNGFQKHKYLNSRGENLFKRTKTDGFLCI